VWLRWLVLKALRDAGVSVGGRRQAVAPPEPMYIHGDEGPLVSEGRATLLPGRGALLSAEALRELIADACSTCSLLLPVRITRIGDVANLRTGESEVGGQVSRPTSE
jgi:hypothetical protein